MADPAENPARLGKAAWTASLRGSLRKSAPRVLRQMPDPLASAPARPRRTVRRTAVAEGQLGLFDPPASSESAANGVDETRGH